MGACHNTDHCLPSLLPPSAAKGPPRAEASPREAMSKGEFEGSGNRSKQPVGARSFPELFQVAVESGAEVGLRPRRRVPRLILEAPGPPSSGVN